MCKNLGVGYSTLTKWLKEHREYGAVQVRGFSNYASDEEKELAHLKRGLRNTQDALDVLKRPSTFFRGEQGTAAYSSRANRQLSWWA